MADLERLLKLNIAVTGADSLGTAAPKLRDFAKAAAELKAVGKLEFNLNLDKFEASVNKAKGQLGALKTELAGLNSLHIAPQISVEGIQNARQYAGALREELLQLDSLTIRPAFSTEGFSDARYALNDLENRINELSNRRITFNTAQNFDNQELTDFSNWGRREAESEYNAYEERRQALQRSTRRALPGSDFTSDRSNRDYSVEDFTGRNASTGRYVPRSSTPLEQLQFMNPALSMGQDVLGKIENLKQQGFEEAVILGSFIDEGIIDGVQKLTPQVAGAMQELAEGGVITPFERAMGIASPAKRMIQAGIFIDEGLQLGIEQGIPSVLAAMTGLGDEIIASANLLSASAHKAGALAGHNFAEGFQAAAKINLDSKLSDYGVTALSGASNAPPALVEQLAHSLPALKLSSSAIDSIAKQVAEKVPHTADPSAVTATADIRRANAAKMQRDAKGHFIKTPEAEAVVTQSAAEIADQVAEAVKRATAALDAAIGPAETGGPPAGVIDPASTSANDHTPAISTGAGGKRKKDKRHGMYSGLASDIGVEIQEWPNLERERETLRRRHFNLLNRDEQDEEAFNSRALRARITNIRASATATTKALRQAENDQTWQARTEARNKLTQTKSRINSISLNPNNFQSQEHKDAVGLFDSFRQLQTEGYKLKNKGQAAVAPSDRLDYLEQSMQRLVLAETTLGEASNKAAENFNKVKTSLAGAIETQGKLQKRLESTTDPIERIKVKGALDVASEGVKGYTQQFKLADKFRQNVAESGKQLTKQIGAVERLQGVNQGVLERNATKAPKMTPADLQAARDRLAANRNNPAAPYFTVSSKVTPAPQPVIKPATPMPSNHPGLEPERFYSVNGRTPGTTQQVPNPEWAKWNVKNQAYQAEQFAKFQKNQQANTDAQATATQNGIIKFLRLQPVANFVNKKAKAIDNFVTPDPNGPNAPGPSPVNPNTRFKNYNATKDFVGAKFKDISADALNFGNKAQAAFNQVGTAANGVNKSVFSVGRTFYGLSQAAYTVGSMAGKVQGLTQNVGILKTASEKLPFIFNPLDKALGQVSSKSTTLSKAFYGVSAEGGKLSGILQTFGGLANTTPVLSKRAVDLKNKHTELNSALAQTKLYQQNVSKAVEESGAKMAASGQRVDAYQKQINDYKKASVGAPKADQQAIEEEVRDLSAKMAAEKRYYGEVKSEHDRAASDFNAYGRRVKSINQEISDNESQSRLQFQKDLAKQQEAAAQRNKNLVLMGAGAFKGATGQSSVADSVIGAFSKENNRSKVAIGELAGIITGKLIGAVNLAVSALARLSLEIGKVTLKIGFDLTVALGKATIAVTLFAGKMTLALIKPLADAVLWIGKLAVAISGLLVTGLEKAAVAAAKLGLILVTGLVKGLDMAVKAAASLAGNLVNLGGGLLNLGYGFDKAGKSADQYGQAVDNASKKNKDFEATQSSGSDFGKKFADGAINVAKFGAAAGLAGAAATYGFVKANASFEQSMANLKATLTPIDRTNANMQALALTATQVGAATSFSSKEAADGFQVFAQMGLNVSQMLAAIAPAANAAEVNNVSLADSAQTAAIVMNAFGISADNLTHVFDVTTKGAQLGVLKFQDFQQAMGAVGTVANITHQSLEGMTAELMALTNAGQQAQDAGTSIKMALMYLMSPTAPGQDALNTLGVRTYKMVTDSAGKQVKTFRQFSDILADFQKAKDSMPEDKFNYYLANAVGSDGIKAITGALNAQQEVMINGQKVLLKGVALQQYWEKELVNSNGELQKSHDIIRDTFLGALDNLNGSFQELAITIGGPVTTVFKDFINSTVIPATNGLLAWEQKNHIIGGSIAAVWQTAMGATTTAVKAGGSALTDFWGGLTGKGMDKASIDQLTKNLKKSGEKVDLSDIVQVSDSKGFFVQAGDKVRGVFHNIQDDINTFKSALKGEWTDSSVIQPLTAMFGRAGQAIRPILHNISDDINTFKAAIKGQWVDSSAIQPFTRIIGNIATDLRKVGSTLGDVLFGAFKPDQLGGKLITTLSDGFKRAGSSLNLKGFSDGLFLGINAKVVEAGSFIDKLGEHFTRVGQAGQTMSSQVTGGLKVVSSFMSGGLVGALITFVDLLIKGQINLKTLQTYFDELTGNAVNFGGTLLKAFEQLSPVKGLMQALGIQQSLGDVLSGAFQKVGEAVHFLIDAVTVGLESVGKFIQSFVQLASQSRILPQAFELIKATIFNVAGALSIMAGALRDAAGMLVPVAQILGMGFAVALKLVADAALMVGRIVVDNFGTIANLVSASLTTLTAGIAMVMLAFEALAPVIETIVGWFLAFADGALQAISMGMQIFAAALYTVLQPINTIIRVFADLSAQGSALEPVLSFIGSTINILFNLLGMLAGATAVAIAAFVGYNAVMFISGIATTGLTIAVRGLAVAWDLLNGKFGAVLLVIGAIGLAFNSNFLGMRDILEGIGKAIGPYLDDFTVLLHIFLTYIGLVKAAGLAQTLWTAAMTASSGAVTANTVFMEANSLSQKVRQGLLTLTTFITGQKAVATAADTAATATNTAATATNSTALTTNKVSRLGMIASLFTKKTAEEADTVATEANSAANLANGESAVASAGKLAGLVGMLKNFAIVVGPAFLAWEGARFLNIGNFKEISDQLGYIITHLKELGDALRQTDDKSNDPVGNWLKHLIEGRKNLDASMEEIQKGFKLDGNIVEDSAGQKVGELKNQYESLDDALIRIYDSGGKVSQMIDDQLAKVREFKPGDFLKNFEGMPILGDVVKGVEQQVNKSSVDVGNFIDKVKTKLGDLGNTILDPQKRAAAEADRLLADRMASIKALGGENWGTPAKQPMLQGLIDQSNGAYTALTNAKDALVTLEQNATNAGSTVGKFNAQIQLVDSSISGLTDAQQKNLDGFHQAADAWVKSGGQNEEARKSMENYRTTLTDLPAKYQPVIDKEHDLYVANSEATKVQLDAVLGYKAQADALPKVAAAYKVTSDQVKDLKKNLMAHGESGNVEVTTSYADSVKADMDKANANAQTGMNQVGGTIASAASGWYSMAYTAGLNVGAGLLAGIEAMQGQIAGAVGALGQSGINKYKSTMQMASPSKVMAQLGKYTVQGLVAGIASEGDNVTGTLGGIADDLTKTVGQMAQTTRNGLAGIMEDGTPVAGYAPPPKGKTTTPSTKKPTTPTVKKPTQAQKNATVTLDGTGSSQNLGDFMTSLTADSLAKASASADAIAKVADAATKMSDAIAKLRAFRGIDTAVVAPFIADVKAILDGFVGLGAKFTVDSAKILSDFSDGVAKIGDAALKFIDLFDKIKNYTAADKTTIDAVVADLKYTVTQFILASKTFTVDMIVSAQIFADGSGKAADAVSKGADALTKLHGWAGVAQPSIEGFVYNLEMLLLEFQKDAQAFTADMYQDATDFSDALTKIVDTVDKGADALKKLLDWKGIATPSIEGFVYNLKVLLANFNNAVDWFVPAMYTAANTFATGLTTVVDTTAKGADALSKLANWQGVATPSIEGFVYNLKVLEANFVNAMDWFTPAMLTTAERFATSIGQVADAAGKAVDPLTKLRGYAAVGDGAIGLFVDDLKLLVKHFQAAIDGDFKVGMFDGANAFADTVSKAVDILDKGVSGFAALAKFKSVAEPVVQQFVDDLKMVVDKFKAAVGPSFTTGMFDAAKALADAAGPVMQALGGAVDTFSKMGLVARPAQSGIDSFIDAIYASVDYMKRKVGDVKPEIFDTVKAFGDAVGSIFTGIKTAIDTFNSLADFKGFDPKVFDALKNSIVAIMVELGKVKEIVEGEMSTQVKEFGDAVTAVFGGLKAAIDVFNEMANKTGVPVKPVLVLLSGILYVAAIMAALSGAVAGPIMADATLFANSLTAIFTALKTAIDTFSDISDKKDVVPQAVALLTGGTINAIGMANNNNNAALALVGQAQTWEGLMSAAGQTYLKGGLNYFSQTVQAKQMASAADLYVSHGEDVEQKGNDFKFKTPSIAFFDITKMALPGMNLFDNYTGWGNNTNNNNSGSSSGGDSAMSNVADTLGKLLDDLDKINHYQSIIKGKLALFKADLLDMMNVFKDLGAYDKNTSDKMGAFADALTKEVGVIAASVDAFDKLNKFAGLANGKIELAKQALYVLLSGINELYLFFNFDHPSTTDKKGVVTYKNIYNDKWAAQVGNFADTVLKVVDIFKNLADASTSLKGFSGISQANMNVFGSSLKLMLDKMNEIMKGIQADPNYTIVFNDLTDSITAIAGAFKNAVEGLNAMRGYTTLAGPALNAVKGDIFRLILAMNDIAYAVKANPALLTTDLDDLTASIGNIAGAFKNSLDFLGAARNYSTLSVQALGSVKNDIFRLILAMNDIYYALQSNPFLSVDKTVQDLATGIGAVASGLKNALDFLKDLKGFRTVSAQTLSDFKTDLANLVAMFVTLTGTVNADLIPKMKDFGDALTAAFSGVKDGLDVLKSIWGYRLQTGNGNIANFMTDLTTVFNALKAQFGAIPPAVLSDLDGQMTSLGDIFKNLKDMADALHAVASVTSQQYSINIVDSLIAVITYAVSKLGALVALSETYKDGALDFSQNILIAAAAFGAAANAMTDLGLARFVGSGSDANLTYIAPSPGSATGASSQSGTDSGGTVEIGNIQIIIQGANQSPDQLALLVRTEFEKLLAQKMAQGKATYRFTR